MWTFVLKDSIFFFCHQIEGSKLLPDRSIQVDLVFPLKKVENLREYFSSFTFSPQDHLFILSHSYSSRYSVHLNCAVYVKHDVFLWMNLCLKLPHSSDIPFLDNPNIMAGVLRWNDAYSNYKWILWCWIQKYDDFFSPQKYGCLINHLNRKHDLQLVWINDFIVPEIHEKH